MHSPVLLQNVIKSLDIKTSGLYIDATVGEGGHLKEILNKNGKVLGIDIDKSQIQDLSQRFKEYLDKGQLQLEVENFANISQIANKKGFNQVDGILVDLGLSFKQIIESGKGLSYNKPNELLDMRLDLNLKVRALDIINSFTEDKLYELFSRNSEDINSRAIAENIVRSRNIKKILTVGDLINVINETLGEKDMSTIARIFQSLRMEVNNELDNLKKVLVDGTKLLKKGGKFLVITFHSIEDRVVKQFINSSDLFSFQELIKGNKLLSYEKSAKLRVFIKK